MMLFSEAKGRKVVSTNSALTLGKVSGFVIDPAAKAVVALQLSRTAGDLSLLPWHRLVTFGADAVTAPGISDLVAGEGWLGTLADRHHEVIKKRVLDSSGRDLGPVRDIDIDPGSGAVVSLLLEKYQIPGAALMGIGSYAVVVAAA